MLALALAVTGCGGGTDATPPAPPSPPPFTATLIAAGSLNFDGASGSGHKELVLRSQSEFNDALVKLPAGAIPPDYVKPDFAKNQFFYLEAIPDTDVGSYVRVERIEETPDEKIIHVEYCGPIDTMIPYRQSYALYVAPVSPLTIRFAWAHRNEDCVTKP